MFMTGDTMSVGSQRFLEETGRPVLNKPLAIDRLGQTIVEVLAEDAHHRGQAYATARQCAS